MEKIEENNVPSFNQLFKRDVTILRCMGMVSMNGILTNREFKNNWWEIIPMFIGIVVLFTTISCQLISMYPISSDQFEYVLELFPFTLSGLVSTIKVKHSILFFISL